MAGPAVTGAINSLEKTGIFRKIGKDFGYYFYCKTKREKARTKIGEVVGKARDLINQCGVGEGLNEDSVQWLVGVGEVIQDWGSIADVPKEWTTLTEDIRKKFGGKLRESSHSRTSYRYTIGRRSTKISEKVEGLIKHYSDDIKKGIEGGTVHSPLPRCDFPLHKEFQAFECRTETVDMVISSIYDDKYRVTQIFGPGGIGKTTMLIEIAKRIQKEMLDSKTRSKKFQRVVYVEVSREPDICDIQDKIVTQLGISRTLKKNDRQHKRASDLQEEIDQIGEVLVILDDVWTHLDMEHIWMHSRKVKVLVGTRKRDLSWIKGNKIAVDSLSDEDSWSLFKQEAGIDETSEVVETAKKVKSECHGLPLALVVIGRALSGEKEESAWKSAVTYLENSDARVKLDVENNLYKIIKYSYDHLPYEITRKMFLCYCLFPGRDKVHEVDIKRYMVGETYQLVGEDERKQVLNQLNISVDTLVSYGLMDRIPDSGILKMHNVIRDTAFYIANEEKFAQIHYGTAAIILDEKAFQEHKRMSVLASNIAKAGDRPDCKELQTLLIRGDMGNKKLDLPQKFFQKMAGLVVLDLSYTEISSLPSSMKCLKNVRTLLLNGCRNLTEVGIIVNLTGLRVLSLRDCVVKVLPNAMNNLVDLVVLDLSTAQEDREPARSRWHLIRGAQNVITLDILNGLPQLQELYMALESITLDIFTGIAKLNLRAVKLYVKTNVLSSEATPTISELTPWLKCNFTIFNHLDLDVDCPLMSQGKNLSIKDLGGATPMVKSLIAETENLIIERCFQGEETPKYFTVAAGGSKFNKTKSLRLKDCNKIEYLCPRLVEPADAGGNDSISKREKTFEELEVIQLTNMKELIGIFEDAVSKESFGKVREIFINSCGKIEYVIPNNVLQKVHEKLQKIRVRDCANVQSIFKVEGPPEAPPGAPYQKFLPVLTSIQLENLMKLESIWQKTLHTGKFENLKEIIVIRCHGLKSLFTDHLAAMLTSLEKLTVEDNEELTEIVSADVNDISQLNEETFHRVSHLSLQWLPKLTHFIPNDDDITVNLTWPVLVQLKLRGCNALARFPMNAESAPHMTRVNDKLRPWYEICKTLPLYLVLVECLSDAL